MNPLLQQLVTLPDPDRMAVLADFSEEQLHELVYDWELWARPNQLLPPGDWSTWLILAGRGYGKTRTGAETVRKWMCGPTPMAAGSYRRVALVAETAADARDVVIEGESGLLAAHPKEFRPIYEPSKRRLTWPNGATGHIYNATEPDQLRGPQHDCFWGDELAKWAYARDAWDQLQFGLRLGKNPRGVVTTTPRPIPVLLEIIADPTSVITKGSTMENKANLAKKFIDKIHKRYAGTRLGRQELEAEVLTDLPGALWVRTYFDPPDGSKDRGRVMASDLPEMERIVVAVDPSGTAGASDDGDSIGIIVAGIDHDGHGYVLADRSVKDGPAGWGRAAVQAYHHWGADRIIGEANYGGAMVESTIRAVDPNVSYRAVNASRGKALRAEPVAALYEQGRISHVIGADPRDEDGIGLTALEDQLCQFGPAGYIGEGSPDRADALVWAFTELMLKGEQGYRFNLNL